MRVSKRSAWENSSVNGLTLEIPGIAMLTALPPRIYDDSTLLTLFIFDSTLPPLQPGNRDRKALFNIAKNALKKLRSIRHPNM